MVRVLEKKERSLGTRLSIRGDRANSPKAAIVRKPYKPGQHGKRFSKSSEFGTQLLEKQKIKFSYGVTERQLKKIFENAQSQKKVSAIDAVMTFLESRLDNVVVRLGLVPSRSAARQLVSHGHFLVNGHRTTTPSYQVKSGDLITLKESSKSMPIFEDIKNKLKNYTVPSSWLSLNKDTLEGKVESVPKDVDFPFNINLVVDYYSKK